MLYHTASFLHEGLAFHNTVKSVEGPGAFLTGCGEDNSQVPSEIQNVQNAYSSNFNGYHSKRIVMGSCLLQSPFDAQ